MRRAHNANALEGRAPSRPLPQHVRPERSAALQAARQRTPDHRKKCAQNAHMFWPKLLFLARQSAGHAATVAHWPIRAATSVAMAASAASSTSRGQEKLILFGKNISFQRVRSINSVGRPGALWPPEGLLPGSAVHNQPRLPSRSPGTCSSPPPLSQMRSSLGSGRLTADCCFFRSIAYCCIGGGCGAMLILHAAKNKSSSLEKTSHFSACAV